jgi:hypothetical protein
MPKSCRGSRCCGTVTFEAGLGRTRDSCPRNCPLCRRTRFRPAVAKHEGLRHH